jgi:hypothetical protein
MKGDIDMVDFIIAIVGIIVSVVTRFFVTQPA